RIFISGCIWRPVSAGGEIRITGELRVSPSDLTELIVSLGGVKFWIVAIAPLYIGWVLAQPSGARHLFIDDLRVVLGIIVIGPLLGTFTLLLNVYSDMETTDHLDVFLAGIHAVRRLHVAVDVQEQREGPEQGPDHDDPEDDPQVVDEQMSPARRL